VSTSVYMGILDSFRTPTITEVEDGYPVAYAGAGDIEFPLQNITPDPVYSFLAWPISAGNKNRWKDKFSLLNSGNIGGAGNLFYDVQTVGGYYVVVTSFRTQFINPIIIF